MDCVHHWKIETPNGAGSVGGGSTGSCIHCGESRQFRNSSPDWFDKFRGSPQEKSLAKVPPFIGLGHPVRRAYPSLGDRPGPPQVLAGSLFG